MVSRYRPVCFWIETSFHLIDKGESNAGAPTNYTCLFSKMIYYWRQTWSERTDGITDATFPFGFVQVGSL